MSSKRIHRKIKRTPEEKKRIEGVRQRFQSERPTPDELLASGEVTEFVPLGEYLDIREAVHALKRERERKGLSLATIAERSKMDKAAISRLENGLQANPTVATLYRYASAIDAQIVWSIRSVD
jgi:ribosome-binding protein aMBF1 (putative translation factor)